MTTYTPIQIEALKLFGKKDLSFGCLVSIVFDSEPEAHREIVLLRTHDQLKKAKEYFSEGNPGILHREILGHEPHLEDLFRVAEEKKVYISFDNRNIHSLVFHPSHDEEKCMEYNPSLPLLEQASLEEIINLFK